MSWQNLWRKLIPRCPLVGLAAPLEAESLLEKGEIKGPSNHHGSSRHLSVAERRAWIERSLAKGDYAEACALARYLPSPGERENLLNHIAQDAAFAEDYRTARTAALLAEQTVALENKG